MDRFFFTFQIILYVLVSLVFFCCAIQKVPLGGPKDVTGPVIISTSPKNGSVNVKPKVVVYYNRSAFYSELYPNVRITFDSNLRGSLTVTGDALSGAFSYILSPHFSIIELKYNNKLPKIFISKIRELELRQATFSKYTTALEVCTEESIISNKYKNKLFYSGIKYL